MAEEEFTVRGDMHTASTIALGPNDAAIVFRADHVDLYHHPEQPEHITATSPLYQVLRTRLMFADNKHAQRIRNTLDKIIVKIMPPRWMQ
jgi:hypothetical protein